MNDEDMTHYSIQCLLLERIAVALEKWVRLLELNL